MHQDVKRRSSAGSQANVPWPVVIFVAVLLVGGVSAFFVVRVCDEDVVESGRTTESCRHLTATDPPVIAVGLIMLVALGTLFEEVSGFGFSLKRRVEAVEDQAQAARQTATETQKVTEELKETDADRAEAVKEMFSLIGSVDLTSDADEPPADYDYPEIGLEEPPLLDQLATKYNEIRWTMPSGPERTQAMSSLLTKMIKAARDLEEFDIGTHLRSEDRGLRLAAFIYLYTNPNPEWTPDLVEAVFKEDKPFGQYWAIRSLGKQVQADPDVLDQNTLRFLRDKLPGTDRERELQRVLTEAG